MAAKKREEIELRIVLKEHPAYQYEQLLPIIRMIEEREDKIKREAYENGLQDAVQGDLLTEKKGE